MAENMFASNKVACKSLASACQICIHVQTGTCGGLGVSMRQCLFVRLRAGMEKEHVSTILKLVDY